MEWNVFVNSPFKGKSVSEYFGIDLKSNMNGYLGFNSRWNLYEGKFV